MRTTAGDPAPWDRFGALAQSTKGLLWPVQHRVAEWDDVVMTRVVVGQADRVVGTLVGAACGDALGVPYELGHPPAGAPAMVGGGLGPYAPGEWSDDTQMSICIARVAAEGADLTAESALDAVASAFDQWRADGATDIGTHTGAVLEAAARDTGSPAARLRLTGLARAADGYQTAGNGALMRTGPVPLSSLDDRDHAADAAKEVARLTHADPLAAESCILWGEAIRVAVLERRLDVRAGLDLLPSARQALWAAYLDEADSEPPISFSNNGFTVVALQAAWSSIRSAAAAATPLAHVVDALTTAIGIGTDTDTVASIAGQLLGACYGTSAFPDRWREDVHGWPGLRADDLADLALRTAGLGP